MAESELERQLVNSSNLIFQLILSAKQGNNQKSEQLFPTVIQSFKELQEIGENAKDLQEIKWTELGCIESGVNLDLMLRDQLSILVQKHQKLIGKKYLLDLYKQELLKE